MLIWIERYQKQAAEARAELERRKAETEAKKIEAFKQRMTPLVDRLKKFIATIPPSERTPRPISFFSQSLRPRHHGLHAAQYLVADGLRQLGFRRIRAWNTPEQGFRTLWHFPDTDDQGNT